MNLALFALPVLFEGRKSATGGGRASTQESRDCFIDLQKVISALHNSNLVSRLAQSWFVPPLSQSFPYLLSVYLGF